MSAIEDLANALLPEGLEARQVGEYLYIFNPDQVITIPNEDWSFMRGYDELEDGYEAAIISYGWMASPEPRAGKLTDLGEY